MAEAEAVPVPPAAPPADEPETCIPPPPRPGCDCAVCVPLGYEGPTNPSGPLSNFKPYKLVKVDADGARRPLTNAEMKDFEKSHGAQAEWNKPLTSCARQWQRACEKLLHRLMQDKKKSWCFKEPVDPVGLGIPDYPVIIKHPMDLGTIETMLKKGEISAPDEFIALVRTVFRNAYVYNGTDDPSGVRDTAQKASLFFEKEIAKM